MLYYVDDDVGLVMFVFTCVFLFEGNFERFFAFLFFTALLLIPGRMYDGDAM